MVTKIPRPHQVEEIQRGLIEVLRGGVRLAWLVDCPEVLELVAEADESDEDPYRRALAVEKILRAGINGLGDGPYGRAAALLFGADQMTCGLLLKDRRRLASAELDVLPSTFRKTYENWIIADVAVEIWRVSTKL